MKLSLLFSLIPFCGFAAFAACTNTVTNIGPADGGSTDALADDGGADASVTVTCNRTVATACATPSATDCPFPTFEAARAAAGCDTTCTVRVSSSACGAYDVAEERGVDTVTSHYFDHTSGSLVAIVRYGATLIGGYTCGAGPSTFDAPSCAASTFVCIGATDGGADAADDAPSAD